MNRLFTTLKKLERPEKILNCSARRKNLNNVKEENKIKWELNKIIYIKKKRKEGIPPQIFKSNVKSDRKIT